MTDTKEDGESIYKAVREYVQLPTHEKLKIWQKLNYDKGFDNKMTLSGNDDLFCKWVVANNKQSDFVKLLIPQSQAEAAAEKKFTVEQVAESVIVGIELFQLGDDQSMKGLYDAIFKQFGISFDDKGNFIAGWKAGQTGDAVEFAEWVDDSITVMRLNIEKLEVNCFDEDSEMTIKVGASRYQSLTIDEAKELANFLISHIKNETEANRPHSDQCPEINHDPVVVNEIEAGDEKSKL